MEPISYLRAPIRRWPVLIPFVLVAMLVAYLIPVETKSTFPSPTWLASAQVALNPSGKGNTLGAKISLKQLVFYAHVPAVIDAAANAAGVKVTPKLQNDLFIGKAKGNKQTKAEVRAGGGGKGKSAPFLEVGVLQPTKARSISMSNAFANALGSYAQLQLDDAAKEKGEQRGSSSSRISRTRSLPFPRKRRHPRRSNRGRRRRARSSAP